LIDDETKKKRRLGVRGDRTFCVCEASALFDESPISHTHHKMFSADQLYSDVSKVKSHKRARSIQLDTLKLLEEKRAKYQQSILKLAGVARLAEHQYDQLLMSSQCPLCGSGCCSKEAYSTMKNISGLCDTSTKKYLDKYHSCSRHIQKIVSGEKGEHLNERSSEWCSFEYKKGQIASMREQKARTIVSGSCDLCGTMINDVSAFLQRTDAQLRSLENELHLHRAN